MVKKKMLKEEKECILFRETKIRKKKMRLRKREEI